MTGRIDTERVRSTVDQIYEAAIDPARWQDTVRDLCNLFEGSRTCFAQFDPQTRIFQHVSTEVDPASVRELKTFNKNVMLETACAAPVGEIYNDWTTIGERTLRHSEFWNDWASPRDMYGSMTCKIHVEGSTFWFLDLQRGRNQTAFDAEDVRLLRTFIPHILRAGKLNQKYQARQALGGVFGSLPFGLMIIDSTHSILAINEVAEQILDTHNGMLMLGGKFRLANRQDELRLEALIDDACASAGNGIGVSGGDMLISTGHHEKRRSYALSVGPLNSTTLFGTSFRSCAAVFIKEARLELPAAFDAFLRANFDLSPSEARLAVALANGGTLKDFSSECGVQPATARTYLDRIFKKTNTHQQSQLVALLRSSAPYGLMS